MGLPTGTHPEGWGQLCQAILGWKDTGPFAIQSSEGQRHSLPEKQPHLHLTVHQETIMCHHLHVCPVWYGAMVGGSKRLGRPHRELYVAVQAEGALGEFDSGPQGFM